MAHGLPMPASPNAYRYKVRENRPATAVIRELWLVPDPRRLAYAAGQYVLLGDTRAQVPPRPYSVANAPRPDGAISLLVTREPGGQTSGWVHDGLRVGDAVTLAGPYGTFVPDPDLRGPVLLLAAGSGLAPARALAEALRVDQPGRPLTLVFSARTRADAIDDARFSGWAKASARFRYLPTLTREPEAPHHQHVPELLHECCDALGGYEVFVSGPPAFVAAAATAAEALGATRAAIHTEEFFTDPQPWATVPPVAPAPGLRR